VYCGTFGVHLRDLSSADKMRTFSEPYSTYLQRCIKQQDQNARMVGNLKKSSVCRSRTSSTCQYIHHTVSFRAKFAVIIEMQKIKRVGLGISQKLYSEVSVEIASRLARPTRSSGATCEITSVLSEFGSPNAGIKGLGGCLPFRRRILDRLQIVHAQRKRY
jgi:hypothetical protein